MTEEIIYFPLGTRCTTASMLADVFKKRVASYPFDWIDIEFSVIQKMLNIEYDNIEAYFTEYFKNVRVSTQRHVEDNTWFPHDFIDASGLEAIQIMTEKYIRRFKRMHELFESGKDILFLTITPFIYERNYSVYFQIMRLLQQKVKGKSQFIAVNITDVDFSTEHFTHFHIPLVRDDNGWELFEKSIAEKLQNDITTSKYFQL